MNKDKLKRVALLAISISLFAHSFLPIFSVQAAEETEVVNESAGSNATEIQVNEEEQNSDTEESSLIETDDYTFQVINENEISLKLYKGNGNVVQVPDEVNGKPVTVIASGAFQSKTTLESVTFSENIYSVEDVHSKIAINLRK